MHLGHCSSYPLFVQLYYYSLLTLSLKCDKLKSYSSKAETLLSQVSSFNQKEKLHIRREIVYNVYMKHYHKLFLGLMLTLVSCGHYYSKAEIDQEAVPFVVAFTHEALLRDVALDLTNLKLTFNEDKVFSDEFTMGHCKAYPRKRIIEIKRSSWVQMDETEKEILMFHELGHCILGFSGHIDDASHIMNEYLLFDYFPDRKTALDNFFEDLTK